MTAKMKGWMGNLVPGLLHQIEQAEPTARVEVKGPFGLRCALSVTVTWPDGRETWFEVQPNRDLTALVTQDYTRRTNVYPAGSIGAVNGLGFAVKPLPPIADLLRDGITRHLFGRET